MIKFQHHSSSQLENVFCREILSHLSGAKNFRTNFVSNVKSIVSAVSCWNSYTTGSTVRLVGNIQDCMQSNSKQRDEYFVRNPKLSEK